MVGMGATSPRPMCRLCLQAADRMTHEDVIPEWLRSHQIAGMDDPTEWSQLIRRVRTRVCGRCNDRMNVAFEQPARPLVIGMLDHDRLRMSGPEQRAVAHWMMKVTLLYGLMRHWRHDVEPAVHPDGSDGWNHAISQGEKRADLHRSMEAGEMPPETTIAVIAASPGKQRQAAAPANRCATRWLLDDQPVHDVVRGRHSRPHGLAPPHRPTSRSSMGNDLATNCRRQRVLATETTHVRR